MKKFFRGALIAVVALGWASCSKDVDHDIDGGLESESVVSFSIKNPKGNLVTRTIAEGEEWDVNSIDVYTFDESDGSLVGKLVSGTDYTETTDNATTTITASKAWVSANIGKTVNFYFVGNDSHIPADFSGDESDFVELTTTALTVNSGKAELISTPLLFSGAAKDVKLVGKVQKNVSLKRREARFDIVNPFPDVFEIEEILVGNANIQGYIFGDATGSATIAQSNHEAITGPAESDYEDEDDEIIAKSVFYLYPTELGADETTISVKAVVGGIEGYYHVNSTGNIEANKRYKLILDAYSLKFTIEVADYDEGDEFQLEQEDDDVVILENVTVSIPANWDESELTYNFEDGQAATVNFSIATANGTDYKVVYALGEQSGLATDIVVNKTSVVAYSGFTVTDTYSIEAPKAKERGFYEILVEIYNASEVKEVITFKSIGGILLTDIFECDNFREWAKTNLADGKDFMTDEEIAAVTTINASDKNITSAKGIERFTNLEELRLGSNPMATLTLSNHSKLKVLYLSASEITSLDLSGCLNLEELEVSYMHNLTSVDVSKLKKLKKIDAYGGGVDWFCSLKKITLNTLNNSYPELTSIRAMGSYLESINVDGCPALEELSLSETKITTLNLNKNTSLQRLYVNNCSKLKELSVYENELTSLDLSGCPSLDDLKLDVESLASIDFSGCPNLVELYFFVGYAKETNVEMQNLSSCTELKSLILPGIEMFSSELVGMSKLEKLYMSSSDNTLLPQFSQWPMLKELVIYEIQLGEFTVSDIPTLEKFTCYANNVGSIVIGDNLPELIFLSIEGDNLTELDISRHRGIPTFECCGLEAVVYVWEDFDFERPSNNFNSLYDPSANVTWKVRD